MFRSCIGQRFARLELYSLMVKLVQQFRMEYAGEGEVGQIMMMMIMMMMMI